jgi:hypothetical protein
MSECNCVYTGHKQDCPLGKDLRIAAMQEQIAILETSLAERWESLNVQDGIIDGLQEEIAALKKERSVDAILKNSADKLTGDLWGKISEQDTRIAALEKVADAAVKIWNPQSWLPVINFDALGEALREAGYLKEEG